mmetsp:Transcript_52096/g.169230  ORF Transcript_52096/g.169230 Transcript_52096/m.169230 type:complete len:204 (+) Transcript_52096:1873-2484(+)
MRLQDGRGGQRHAVARRGKASSHRRRVAWRQQHLRGLRGGERGHGVRALLGDHEIVCAGRRPHLQGVGQATRALAQGLESLPPQVLLSDRQLLLSEGLLRSSDGLGLLQSLHVLNQRLVLLLYACRYGLRRHDPRPWCHRSCGGRDREWPAPYLRLRGHGHETRYRSGAAAHCLAKHHRQCHGHCSHRNGTGRWRPRCIRCKW